MSETPKQREPSSLTMASVGVVFAAGVFLIYAGLSKTVELSTFAGVVESHDLFSPPLSRVVAYTMPWAETAMGLGVVLSVATHGRRLHVWTWTLTAIFAAFAVYTGLLWLKPPPKPTSCGCGFSFHIVKDWSLPFIRNVAGTLVLSVCAALLHRCHANSCGHVDLGAVTPPSRPCPDTRPAPH